MELIIGIAIGIAIGWHFPQPPWFQVVVDWVKKQIK